MTETDVSNRLCVLHERTLIVIFLIAFSIKSRLVFIYYVPVDTLFSKSFVHVLCKTADRFRDDNIRTSIEPDERNADSMDEYVMVYMACLQ